MICQKWRVIWKDWILQDKASGKLSLTQILFSHPQRLADALTGVGSGATAATRDVVDIIDADLEIMASVR